jgi:hypothetical protein
MMLRRVADLAPGDSVQPSDSGSIWTVVRMFIPAEGRCELTLGKPWGDEWQLMVAWDDLISVVLVAQ